MYKYEDRCIYKDDELILDDINDRCGPIIAEDRNYIVSLEAMIEELKKASIAAIESEREACARIAHEVAEQCRKEGSGRLDGECCVTTAENIEAAIRKRGEDDNNER